MLARNWHAIVCFVLMGMHYRALVPFGPLLYTGWQKTFGLSRSGSADDVKARLTPWSAWGLVITSPFPKCRCSGSPSSSIAEFRSEFLNQIRDGKGRNAMKAVLNAFVFMRLLLIGFWYGVGGEGFSLEKSQSSDKVRLD